MILMTCITHDYHYFKFCLGLQAMLRQCDVCVRQLCVLCEFAGVTLEDDEEDRESEEKWTDASVRALISVQRDMEEMFQAPKCKKGSCGLSQ